MGKSRLLDELAVDPVLTKDTVVTPITFNTKTFSLTRKEKCLEDAILSFVSRLLFSYFLDNDERRLDGNVFETFSAFMIKNERDVEIKEAVAMIKKHMSGLVALPPDLIPEGRSPFNKTHLLIGVDEIKKLEPRKVTTLLSALCSLTDDDKDVALFVTTLNTDVFTETTNSGRVIEYVPLEPLSFEASVDLLRNETNLPDDTVTVLRRPPALSGYCSANLAPTTPVHKIMDLVMSKLNSLLDWSVVKKLLLARDFAPLMSDDVARGTVFVSTVGSGTNAFLPMTSPLFLRKWALDEGKESNDLANHVKSLLRDIFERLGWTGSKECAIKTFECNGEDFAHIHRCMQTIRMLLQYRVGNTKTSFFERFKPSMRSGDVIDGNTDLTQRVQFKTSHLYRTELFPTSEGPSKNLKFPDDFNRNLAGHYQPKEQDILSFANINQPGFDFCMFHQSNKGLIVEAVEPRFAKERSDSNSPNKETIDVILGEYDHVQQMDWSRVGVDVQNVALVFVLHKELDNMMEHWRHTIKDKNIIVLTKRAIEEYYGPSLFKILEPAFKVSLS